VLVQVDRFVRDFIIQRGQANELMARGSLWHDMASWYPVHRDSHVLWLHYEDLVQVCDRCSCVAASIALYHDCAAQLALKPCVVMFGNMVS
jgi:hypothetical protein